jgi:hypothetical protein
MLRLTDEAALPGVAARAFEADAEFSRREQARLAELAALGARSRVARALSRTAGHEQRPEQRANYGAM